MPLSNDERGWVMTCLSGIACALGASVICVDVLVRLFPSQRNFRIQDSDTFLSISLSLSFGVMLFSSLYSMLPSAKQSLTNGGFSPKEAAWVLIGCFIGGVIGIQILSRIMHVFIPSHVVDCEHNHDDGKPGNDEPSHDDEEHALSHSSPRAQGRKSSIPAHSRSKPPSRQSSHHGRFPQMQQASNSAPATASQPRSGQVGPAGAEHASFPDRMTRTLTQLTTSKDTSCDCDGPCYGYSDPCAEECFKKVSDRGGFKASSRNGTLKPPMIKSATVQSVPPVDESTPLLQDIAEEQRPKTDHAVHSPTRYYTIREGPSLSDVVQGLPGHNDFSESTAALPDQLHKTHTNETLSSHDLDHHHHHVPTNAFLSIGLQTSIAIALHKLPEGFITYATNHANPKLGVAVFLALFIHNITEGFAMALPLYLAIQNRTKAMVISFALGGLSQPLGAAVAAVWFKLAGDGDWAPNESVYGGMFAVTAGIMTSVALQLFGESLDLTHSKILCFVGAFCGMTILGISSALTA